LTRGVPPGGLERFHNVIVWKVVCNPLCGISVDGIPIGSHKVTIGAHVGITFLPGPPCTIMPVGTKDSAVGTVTCVNSIRPPPVATSCFVLDFETDDSEVPLADRQRIDAEFDGGPSFPLTITSSSNLSTCGTIGGTAAIYDSDLPPHGQDPDLAVNSGNILILQTDANLTECSPGFFCSGNDDDDGGTLTFVFNEPVEPISVDLIDVDNPGPDGVVTVTLADSSSDTRTYTVPVNWTGDILAATGPGQATLILDGTAQAGPGPGSPVATAVTDLAFDPADVVLILIERGDDCPGHNGGSGAIDNLIWCQ